MTKEEAKQLVDARINAVNPYAVKKTELAIIDDVTIEKEYGWVFFYETKEYLKTCDFVDTLVGNAPYIVNKYTGEVIETGTAYPVDEYIEEYEKESGYGV